MGAGDWTDRSPRGDAPPRDRASAIRHASDSAGIRDVIHRWISASLAGDATAACALVDPAKLSYLEQIDMPCEQLQSGTLTPESERGVRSTRITAVEVHGDKAVAHTRSRSGARDIDLHRVAGTWLIREF